MKISTYIIAFFAIISLWGCGQKPPQDKIDAAISEFIQNTPRTDATCGSMYAQSFDLQSHELTNQYDEKKGDKTYHVYDFKAQVLVSKNCPYTCTGSLALILRGKEWYWEPVRKSEWTASQVVSK